MVVEKNRASRIMLSRTLRLMDFEVLQIEDCGLAAEVCGDGVDIVFVSLDLPGGKGYDLINNIKASPTAPYTIALSSGNDPFNLAIKAGADDMILKPLKKALIESRVALAVEEIKNEFTVDKDSFDVLDELLREHRLLVRTAAVFEEIISRIHDDIPQKILDWMDDTAFVTYLGIHNRKEINYLLCFLEEAMSEQGESPRSKIFSRTSLKKIEEEHEILEDLLKDIHTESMAHAEGAKNVDRVLELLGLYCQLLREHIKREERFLFPFSKKYITPENSRMLRVEFNKIDKNTGTDKLHRIEKIIGKMEGKLGLSSHL